MIRFICQCGQRLKSREEHAGKPVRCPVCKEVQAVPTLGLAAGSWPLPTSDQPKGFFRELDEEMGRDA
jgi:hypothetical protein